MTLIEQVNNMNIDDLRMLNKLAISRINELTANYRFNFKKGDLVTVKMNTELWHLVWLRKLCVRTCKLKL